MMPDVGLRDETVAALRRIFEKFAAIERVTLYGSRAKGTFNERSDIDLVAFGQGIERDLIADVLMDLDDSDIPYLVDLQNYHDLKNKLLIEHINRVGIVIYQKSTP